MSISFAVAVAKYTDSGRRGLMLLLTCGLSRIELYIGLVAAIPLSKLK